MRSTTATQDTDLNRTAYDQHARVEVQNADGTWIELTSLGASSLDWFLGCSLSTNVDQPWWEGRFRFRRDRRDGTTEDSLAPQRTDSDLNEDDLGAYAPLLDAGRGIRMDVSVTAPGVAASYERVFDGVIDVVDAAGEQINVVARSTIGADIVDSYIEDRSEYGTTGGTALETVIQSVLTDWAQNTITLWTPSSPGQNVTPGWWHGISVADALQRLSGWIGWNIQEVYDDGTSAWRLRFADPDRAKTVPDWTFGPEDYFSVEKSAISRHQVRNAITVGYYDSTGLYNEYTTSDATSIARYGRRWIGVYEDEDSPIDTAGEAQTMADAIIADLKDPDLEYDVTTRFFWPAELGDLYRFSANDRHFNANQDLAVWAITHQITVGSVWKTRVATRGAPVGYLNAWKTRKPKVRNAPDNWIRILGYRWEPQGEAGANNEQNFRLKITAQAGRNTIRLGVSYTVDELEAGIPYTLESYTKLFESRAEAVQEFTLLDSLAVAKDFRVRDSSGTTVRDLIVGTISFTPYADAAATIGGQTQLLTVNDVGTEADGSGTTVDTGSQVYTASKLVAGTNITFTINSDGTLTISSTGGGATALDDLTDVTITAAATGEFLRYNGSAWVDSLIQTTDITEAMVTQHEAALTILTSQISGSFVTSVTLQTESGLDLAGTASDPTLALDIETLHDWIVADGLVGSDKIALYDVSDVQNKAITLAQLDVSLMDTTGLDLGLQNAGTGLVESPTGTVNINYSSASNFILSASNTQSILSTSKIAFSHTDNVVHWDTVSALPFVDGVSGTAPINVTAGLSPTVSLNYADGLILTGGNLQVDISGFSDTQPTLVQADTILVRDVSGAVGADHFEVRFDELDLNLFDNTNTNFTANAFSGALNGLESPSANNVGIKYDGTDGMIRASLNGQYVGTIATGEWIAVQDSTTPFNVYYATVSQLPFAATSHTHAASDITSGQLGTAFGGTGVNGPTSGYLLVGAGGSPMTELNPGAAGGFVRSDGSSWVRGTISSGDLPSHTHSASQITAGTFGSGDYVFPGTGSRVQLGDQVELMALDRDTITPTQVNVVSVPTPNDLRIGDDAWIDLDLRATNVLVNGSAIGTVSSVNITPGTGLDATGGPITTSGSITVSLDFSELADRTAAATDKFVFYSPSGAGQYTDIASGIPLSIFLDDLGYTTYTGGDGITVSTSIISVDRSSGGAGLFATAWDDATTPIASDAMIFGDGGLTGIASTVLFSSVNVGIFNNDGTYYGQGDTILAAFGSEAAPGFAFNTDADTGMYRYQANGLAFSVGNNLAVTINSSQVVEIRGDTESNLWLYELDAAADEKRWRWVGSSGDLYLQTVTDAGAANDTVMRFYNSGGTVTQIDLDSDARVTQQFAVGTTIVDYINVHLAGSFASGGASTIAEYLRYDGTVTAATGDTSRWVGDIHGTDFISQSAYENITAVHQAWFLQPTITDNLLDSATLEDVDSIVAGGGSSPATVTTSVAHGFTTGDHVIIKGSGETAYNGYWTVTDTGASTVTLDESGAVGVSDNPSSATIQRVGRIQLASTVRVGPAPTLKTGDGIESIVSTWALYVEGASSMRDVIPFSDGGYDLGTTAIRWGNLYVDDVVITNDLTMGGTLDVLGLDVTSSTGGAMVRLNDTGAASDADLQTYIDFRNNGTQKAQLGYVGTTVTDFYINNLISGSNISFRIASTEYAYVDATGFYTDALVDTATRIGQTAHSLTDMDAAADFAQPSGYRTMARNTSLEQPQGNGTANATYYFWNVMARRDSGGGYNGLALQYTGGRVWYGQNSLSTSLPNWYEVFTEATPQLLPTGDGSVSAPMYSYNTDQDTGHYLETTGIIGVAAAGQEVGRWFSGGLYVQSTAGGQLLTIRDMGATGSSANPYIRFEDSASTDLGYIGFGSTTTDIFYITQQRGAPIALQQSAAVDESVRIIHASGQTNPYYSVYHGTTREYYWQWQSASNILYLNLEQSVASYFRIASGGNLKFEVRSIDADEGRVSVDNAQFVVRAGGTQYEDTGTVTPDWDLSNQHLIDFDSTSTTTTININDTVMEAGGSYVLLLQYNAGSGQSLSWSSSTALIWANGTAPTTATGATAGDITVVQFFKTTTGTTKIIGSWFVAT